MEQSWKKYRGRSTFGRIISVEVEPINEVSFFDVTQLISRPFLTTASDQICWHTTKPKRFQSTRVGKTLYETTLQQVNQWVNQKKTRSEHWKSWNKEKKFRGESWAELMGKLNFSRGFYKTQASMDEDKRKFIYIN